MPRCLLGPLLFLLAPPAEAAAPPGRRVDAFGDPLPPGAIARLGTARTHGLASLSPDGKVLAVSRDPGITLVDTRTGRLLRKLPCRGNWAPPFFVAGGRHLIGLHTSREHALQVWEVDSGRPVAHVERVKLHAAGRTGVVLTTECLSADGNRFAVCYDEDGQPLVVTVWQREPLRMLRQITLVHTRRLWAHLSRDGSVLVTGGRGPADDGPLDHLMQVWHLGGGKDQRIEVGGTPPDSRAALSPDGKLVAVPRTTDVGLWETATGRLARTIPLAWHPEERLLFSADGKRLLVAGPQLRVYDPLTGRLLGEHNWPFRLADRELGSAMHWAQLVSPPGGKSLVLAPRVTPKEVWELETGRLITPPSGHAERVQSLVFSPDGKHLHSGDLATYLFRWDLSTGRAAPRFGLLLPGDFRGAGWLGVTLTPDGRRAFTPRRWEEVRAHDAASGRLLYRLPWPASFRTDWCQPASSADGSKFVLHCRADASEKTPGEVQTAIRDTATGKPLLPLHFKEVFGVKAAFSPDAARLVTAALVQKRGDRGVELTAWDVRTGTAGARARLAGNDGDLAVAADGRSVLVLANRQPCRLFVWDMVTGTTRQVRTDFWGQALSGPTFSPDGRLFIVACRDEGGEDTRLHVCEWTTLSERFVFRGFDAPKVCSVAVSPDGRTLASPEGDGPILLWDLMGGVDRQMGMPPTPAVRLWERLAGEEASKAWPAMRELMSRPADAVRLLRARVVLPPPPPDDKRLAALLAGLDADSAAERDEATRRLRVVARLVEPELRQALRGARSAEVKNRLSRLLAALDRLTPDEVRHARAVEVLERVGSPLARALLGEWAVPSSRAVLAAHAGAALRRMGR
jgi:WD40 repeat protein